MSTPAGPATYGIAVVGGGTMGAGIAEIAARRGFDVVVVDPEAEGAARRVERSVARASHVGKLSFDDAESALRRITFETDIGVLGTQRLIVEAAPEIEDLKVEVFRQLDEVARPDAVLATNTSSIPVVKLASVTKRPGQVIGIHFFNPVPVLPLVEIIETLLTSAETTQLAVDFAREGLGKRVIHAKDRAGFVVNSLLIPYLLSAVRMHESGFASAGDIDRGMVDGCAHPMGPLALCDLIGLDTTVAVARSLYEEFKEPLFAPPPLLLRMVDAGLLGRKSGRGFFSYGG